MSRVEKEVTVTCSNGSCNLGYEPQEHTFTAAYSTVTDTWSVLKDGELLFGADDNELAGLIEAIQQVAATDRVYGLRFG